MIMWRLSRAVTSQPQIGHHSEAKVLIMYRESLQTTGKVLAHYYTSLVQAHPAYRIQSPFLPSPLPLHSPTPAPAPALDVTMSITHTSSNNAPSPPLEHTAAPQYAEPRGRSSQPAPISSSFHAGPAPPSRAEPVLHPAIPPNSQQFSPAMTRTASPALIPAPSSRRETATASHLPSPVRARASAPDLDPAGWVGLVTRSLSGVAADRSARSRSRRGSGSTVGSRGRGSGTTGGEAGTSQTSPASSLASSGGSGSPPMPMPMPVVVVDGAAAGGVGAGQPVRLLLSPGKRGASRDPSADPGRDARRRQSPVVRPGRD